MKAASCAKTTDNAILSRVTLSKAVASCATAVKNGAETLRNLSETIESLSIYFVAVSTAGIRLAMVLRVVSAGNMSEALSNGADAMAVERASMQFATAATAHAEV